MSITRGNSQEDEIKKLQKLIDANNLTKEQREMMYAMLNAYQNLLQNVSATAGNVVSEVYNDPRVSRAMSTQTFTTIQQPQVNPSQTMLRAGTVVASYGLELMKDMVTTKNPNRKDMAEIKVLTDTFNNTAAVIKSPNKDNVLALARNIQPLTQMMTKSEKRRKLVGGILLGIGIGIAVALLATAITAAVVATSGAGLAILPAVVGICKVAPFLLAAANSDVIIGNILRGDAKADQRNRTENITNAYNKVKDDINKLPAAATQQAKQLAAVENKENKATAGTTDREASAEERRSYRNRS